MPRGTKILGKPIDEEKWQSAKERAAEEGHAEDYDYIMGIYKRMAKVGEFREEHISDRKKRGEKLPEWKEKRWDSKKHTLKQTKKSIDLILPSPGMDEFRCGECGAMLLKGLHLEKAVIEVKCKRCGSLVVNLN